METLVLYRSFHANDYSTFGCYFEACELSFNIEAAGSTTSSIQHFSRYVTIPLLPATNGVLVTAFLFLILSRYTCLYRYASALRVVTGRTTVGTSLTWSLHAPSLFSRSYAPDIKLKHISL